MHTRLPTILLALLVSIAVTACDDDASEPAEATDETEAVEAEAPAMPEALQGLQTDREPLTHHQVGNLHVTTYASHELVPEDGFYGLYVRVLFYASEDAAPEIDVNPRNASEVMDFLVDAPDVDVDDDTIRLGELAAGETAELILGISIAERDRITSYEFLTLTARDGDAHEEFTLEIERADDREITRATRDVALMQRVWTLRADRAIDTGMARRAVGELEEAGERIADELATLEAHLEDNIFPDDFVDALKARLQENIELAGTPLEDDAEGEDGEADEAGEADEEATEEG